MPEIVLEVAFRPEFIMPLCNWLRGVNAALMLEAPDLPLLYDSGVIYAREEGERFRDTVRIYRAGQDDCDSLAPARAGELVARGWEALDPGDEGFELAQELRPASIDAWCFFTTRSQPDEPGPRLYHVEVNYRIGNETFHDDPSARLGMYDGRIDPAVAKRWLAKGVKPGQPVARVGRLCPVEVGRVGRHRRR